MTDVQILGDHRPEQHTSQQLPETTGCVVPVTTVIKETITINTITVRTL